MKEPWICPRCGRVNAHWLPCCSCKSQIQEQTSEPIMPKDQPTVSNKESVDKSCGNCKNDPCKNFFKCNPEFEKNSTMDYLLWQPKDKEPAMCWEDKANELKQVVKELEDDCCKLYNQTRDYEQVIQEVYKLANYYTNKYAVEEILKLTKPYIKGE